MSQELPESTGTIPPRRKRRRWSMVLLIAGLLLLGIYGWLRLQQSLVLWDVLNAIEVRPGPLYLAASGAAWGLLSSVAGLGLLFRQWWAPDFTRVAVIIMAAWYWLDRLVLVQSEAVQANLPFAVLATILCLAYVFAVLRIFGRVAP